MVRGDDGSSGDGDGSKRKQKATWKWFEVHLGAFRGAKKLPEYQQMSTN